MPPCRRLLHSALSVLHVPLAVFGLGCASVQNAPPPEKLGDALPAPTASAEDDIPSFAPGEVGVGFYEQIIEKTVGLHYMFRIPDTYDPIASTKCPVILFLHGAGERGDNLDKIRDLGPLGYARRHPDFPFIVIAPQCPTMQDWDPDALVTLLDNVLDGRIPADPARVYLTGFSMGGAGTWETAIDAPGRFAALAPLCGRNIPLLSARIWQKPVWVFHGEKDDVVPFRFSQDMVDTLRGMGNDRVKFTTFPDDGHEIWGKVYEMPELYAWFLQQRPDAAGTR